MTDVKTVRKALTEYGLLNKQTLLRAGKSSTGVTDSIHLAVESTLPHLFSFSQGPLPLRDDNGIVLLGERAAKCRAYAKALHYKELEFQKGPSPLILESLIR